VLVNDQANAVITAGNGNNIIVEKASGASITLGNGKDVVFDPAGKATIVAGNGEMFITLGGTANAVTIGDTTGGRWAASMIDAGAGGAAVVAGNGDVMVIASGAHNTITVGKGDDVIILRGPSAGTSLGALQDDAFQRISAGDASSGDRNHCGGTSSSTTAPLTSDIVNLGSGTNMVFLAGSGNTVNAGGGTDTILAFGGSNDKFVLSAAGGSEIISGFTTANGDRLDLSKALAGVKLAPDLSDLGTYVSATSKAGWETTSTVLKVTAGGTTEIVTLANGGALSLSSLLSHNSLILPAH
jgi:hypothetical protein